MRIVSHLVALGVAVILAACGGRPGGTPPDGPPAENCAAPGDEDGNGLADCGDPACAGTPECQPACGNRVKDPGEQCDDGNLLNGDGCDSNCTLPACGNGIMDTGEQCDDGNRTDGDGCESNCTIPQCGNGVMDDGEQCDDGNRSDGDGCDSNCTFPGCGNAIVDAGERCDDGNAVDGDGCDNSCVVSPIVYLKASNTGGADSFGWRVALSADGSTMAVGAPLEASAATSVGGNQSDNSADGSGAVYVYIRRGTTWRQEAYLKASNTAAGDRFGGSVALSADGSTLAVGAVGEASAATGVNGNQADNSAARAGAVYVFTRRAAIWRQDAYVKASNPGVGDELGTSIALSADGATLAVGAFHEDAAATGIGGDQADDSMEDSGAVYVFTRGATTWAQQAYVKASNTGVRDLFGFSVALSANGSTLAVSAVDEDSAATGVDGDQGDNSLMLAGAAYVFTRSGSTWSQQAYVKASNTGFQDEFGFSIALSADGSTLAVGARFESSAATGIDGNQTDDSADFAGAVYVFTHSGTTWAQEAYVKASNTDVADLFGESVALSADGSTLAVGAIEEASAATGIGGDQTDSSVLLAGAVYTFARSGATWGQEAYIKASNTGSGDEFGISVALAADASILAVGAQGEGSAATGVAGNQADNSAASSGAVYVYQ